MCQAPESSSSSLSSPPRCRIFINPQAKKNRRVTQLHHLVSPLLLVPRSKARPFQVAFVPAYKAVATVRSDAIASLLNNVKYHHTIFC